MSTGKFGVGDDAIGSLIRGARVLRTRGVAIGRSAWTRTWTARSRSGCSRRACCARTAARSTSASATAESSGVRGRGDDRVNRGRLGPKGLYGWQANNSADRLLHPLVRRDGELRRGELGRGDEPGRRALRRAARDEGRRRARVLHERTALPRGLLHAGARRPRRDRDEPPRRQHAPLHGDRGAVVEGDVRLRRPAERRPRHRVLRHDPARRDQHGRDADGPLDARARPTARPRSAALDRDRPTRDGVGAGGAGPSRDQAGNEPGRPERARSATDRERPHRP